MEGASGEGRRVGADLVLQPSLTSVLSWGALIHVLLLSSSPRNTNTLSVFFLQSAEAEARRRPLVVVSSIEFSSFFFS